MHTNTFPALCISEHRSALQWIGAHLRGCACFDTPSQASASSNFGGDKIFVPATKGGEPLKEREANVITFGRIIDKNGETVDDVLVSLFRKPRSYTGEDSVEISCHGSRYILEKVLCLLIENGCRQATAGEYTQRAFLNGKMDLSQAEAVADLIASQSAATHCMAMSQMRGE